MIRDLSETLQAILDDPTLGKSFPELAQAQVAFDRPSEQFNPSQTTIDVFLFDIRENLELRTNEPVVERRDGQAVIRRPPKRVDCSYLLTAWAAGGTGPNLVLLEHELLGQAMQVLSRHPTIPAEFLQGDLKAQSLPVPLAIGAGENIKDPADFWSALGNRLRPALVVTVTVELQTVEPETVWVAKTHDLRLTLLSQAGAEAAAGEQPATPKTRAPAKRTAATKSAGKSSKKSSKKSVKRTARKSAKKSTAKKSSAKR